jgi:hypothetical protein
VAVWLSSCDCLAASEASRFSLSSVSLSRKSTHRSANDCTRWHEDTNINHQVVA